MWIEALFTHINEKRFFINSYITCPISAHPVLFLFIHYNIIPLKYVFGYYLLFSAVLCVLIFILFFSSSYFLFHFSFLFSYFCFLFSFSFWRLLYLSPQILWPEDTIKKMHKIHLFHYNFPYIILKCYILNSDLCSLACLSVGLPWTLAISFSLKHYLFLTAWHKINLAPLPGWLIFSALQTCIWRKNESQGAYGNMQETKKGNENNCSSNLKTQKSPTK